MNGNLVGMLQGSELLRIIGITALAVMNIVTFFVYAEDKKIAVANAKNRTQKRRIPIRTLLLLAVLFGSGGAIFSMELFRHKTTYQGHNSKFQYLYLLFTGHCILLILAWKYGIL